MVIGSELDCYGSLWFAECPVLHQAADILVPEERRGGGRARLVEGWAVSVDIALRYSVYLLYCTRKYKC